ncbi:MAG: twin-arginine translocase subunit TatC [Planctomycetota bacterium]|nr:twin-arginine translocase subunit TatC [Planctomycetota bacterium]MDA1105683.1 twin-arginine translocase subunit TatC [Planctomycetota bacterium]
MSDPSDEVSSMSFGNHLEELRRRLFWAMAFPLPASIILFFFAPTMREFLCAPVLQAQQDRGLPTSMQVMSPVEALATDFKLSLIAALVLSAPWVLWQAWLFVSPGLYIHERRFARFLVPLSSLLVAGGMALLYWVMLPLMMSGLIGFGESPPTIIAGSVASPGDAKLIPVVAKDPESARPGELWFNTQAHELRLAIPGSEPISDAQPAEPTDATATLPPSSPPVEIVTIGMNRPKALQQVFRLKEYIDFVLLVAMAVAITFQLPVAILLLGWIGIVDPPMLRRKRKFALFAITIVAAIAGPGDLLTMALLMVPLYALYEGSILLLVMAPAHRVSAGTVGRRSREPDGDASEDS